MRLREDKLGEVIKGLTSLGTPRGLMEQAKFYFGYLMETRAELARLLDDTKKGAHDVEASQVARAAEVAQARAERQSNPLPGPTPATKK